MTRMISELIKEPSEVCKIPPEHKQFVVDIIAHAFFHDPLIEYLIPCESKRLTEIQVFNEVNVNHVMKNGEILGIKSPNSSDQNPYAAVSLWYHGSNAFGSLWSFIQAGAGRLVKTSYFGRLSKMRTIQNQLEHIHKTAVEENHYYLSVLGADPRYKGQKFTSKLLKTILLNLDREKISTYLETMNINNISLYQHFGYQIVGEVNSPQLDLHVWSLLRKSK